MKELEMILQAVAQLGDAGKEAFVWWLVMDKGLGFLGWILTVIAIAFVILKISKHISLDGMQNLRDAMGVGCPGPVSEEEIHEMHRWVRARREK